MKSRLCISLILLYVSFAGFVTPIHGQSVRDKLSAFRAINRYEKIYLQTDRPVYVAGEEIWFSAFVLEGFTQTLNTSEAVMHLELVNPEGISIDKQLFKIKNGRVWGSLTLNSELKDGKYHLVAFTNWMRNDGSEFYFSKELAIQSIGADFQNTTTATPQDGAEVLPTIPQKPTHNSATEISMKFYPEGGNLVAGLINKVAFEILDEFGQSMNLNGMVVNEQGDVITAANALWKGKGSFAFLPVPGQKYFVNFEGNNITPTHFALPEISSDGLALGIKDLKNQQQLQLLVSRVGEREEHKEVFVLALQNSIPKMSVTIDLSVNPQAAITIEKGVFKTGMVQFTVFDSQKVPQAERLFFIKNNDQPIVEIEELKAATSAHDKVDLSVLVSDAAGNPISGDFAFSVTDMARVPDAAYHSSDIFQYINLYSDLPEVDTDSPNIFKGSREGDFKMDLIMLTNGWLRYTWKEVLQDTLHIPQYLEEPGIYIKGHVLTNTKNPKIPKETQVTMITQGKKPEIFYENIDAEGAFTFVMRDFNDTLRAMIQTENDKGNKKDYDLELYTNFTASPEDKYGSLLDYSNGSVPYAPLGENVTITKGEVTKSLQRAIMGDELFANADVILDEFTVAAQNKNETDKEEVTRKYGAPDYSVGEKRIMELADQKKWHTGLMSLLTNSFPNLDIEVYALGESTSIKMFLKDRKRHRFFIFVDGEMLAASDVKGSVDTAFRGYTVDDLVGIEPSAVKNVDLIFPGTQLQQNALNGRAEIYEYTMTEYSDDNTEIANQDMEQLMQESETFSTPVAVIAIYTKNGSGVYSRQQFKGVANVTLRGFTRVREFYQPDYSNEKEKVLSDFRNTLAWIPNFSVGATGRNDVSFYTSDVSSTYRVEVNGVTSNGGVGTALFKRSEPMFEVNAKAEVKKREVELRTLEAIKLPQITLPDANGAAYAFIQAPFEGWETYSSLHGYYQNPKKSLADTSTVILSKPGYETVSTTYGKFLAGKLTLQNVVELKPNEIAAMDGRDVMKGFFRNMWGNRKYRKLYLEGAYRESLFAEKDLHQFSDFYFIQQWNPLTEPMNKVVDQVKAGRFYRSIDKEDHIWYTPKYLIDRGIPVMDPLFSDISFLNQSMSKQYTYTLQGIVEYLGRKMYHVTFDQNEGDLWALYQGELYIDVANYDLTWVKWRVSDKGKKYLMPEEYIVSGGDQQQFKVNAENNEMTWKFKDDQWIPWYAISEVNFSQGEHTATIQRELMWKPTEEPIEKFKKLVPRDMEVVNTLQKSSTYKPAGWRSEDLLPINEELNRQTKYLNRVANYNMPPKKGENAEEKTDSVTIIRVREE